MKKRAYTLKTIISLVIIMILVIGNFTPAYAWKVKTHVYSANLIIDEIIKNRGYVEIEPYGKFKVVPEYYNLIRSHPEFYRAGALGPDLFSDIVIGQTIIHTGNDFYTSGELIEKFWDAAKILPEYTPSETERMLNATISSTITIEHYDEKDPNDPANQYLRVNNKMQARAFMLGYMAHAAGDYFGHSYINHWAGGTWPTMTDGLTQDEKNIIRRHSVIEAYIDSMIPQEYKSNEKNQIRIPQRFVFDNMLVWGNVDINNMANDHRQGENFGSKKGLAPHLNIFFTMRDALRSNINSDCNFIEKAYCEAWIEDIDKGLGDWVATNERAAQLMVSEDGNMSMYFDELKKWSDKHTLSMFGVPDVATYILSAMGSASDFLKELLPDAVVEVIEEAKKSITYYMVKQATGIDIEEYIAIMNPPLSDLKSETLFSKGFYDQLNLEMGNFSLSTDTTDQTFIPFKNTLTLMKLSLIGEEGIQELRNRAGSTGTRKQPSDTITKFINSMDYGYDWDKGAFSTDIFFLSLDNEDLNKVTKVIFNINGQQTPKTSFSDMTKGPVSVAPNQSSSGVTPTIKVKYNNAPDEVNAVIGLYPADNFSSNSATSWKYIAKATNGEYEVSAPLKGGKYHFRIYDTKGTLLAKSETIQVIEANGELRSYFEEIPTGNFTPSQSLSVNFINNLKTKGFIGLYNDNELDPQKTMDRKITLNGKTSLYQIVTYAPEEPGNYRFRAYDENLSLVAESSLIVVEGTIDTIITPETPPTPTNLNTKDIKTIGVYDICDYEGQNGSVFSITVTGKLNGTVWGSGIYTNDSDVEVAAVHAGIVKVGETKTVKITILPGQNSYESTMRNGIKTDSYGDWHGSFKFTDVLLPLTTQSPTNDSVIYEADDIDLSEFRGYNGTVLNVRITGNLDGNVWGSDIYSDDSYISTAAVHAGVVKNGETKTVKITILPGQNSYVGTLNNGVESEDYDEWDGSFKFNETPPLTSQNSTNNLKIYDANDIDLSQYRGLSGTVLDIKVTGSLDGAVWGSEVYSDDSDISTAAVHAGVVKVGETKTLKITILPGQNSYVGTSRNGIESESYDEWDGSFKFK